MGAETLVPNWISSHQCTLLTAADAHVREYALAIPRDCIAAPDPSETRFALRYFEDVLGAATSPGSRTTLRR